MLQGIPIVKEPFSDHSSNFPENIFIGYLELYILFKIIYACIHAIVVKITIATVD